MQDCFLQTTKRIEQKLLFTPISKDTKKILSSMWKQPMATPFSLQRELGYTPVQLQNAITTLIQNKVISITRLKHTKNLPIFICEDIFQSWHYMDEQVFNKGEKNAV